MNRDIICGWQNKASTATSHHEAGTGVVCRKYGTYKHFVRTVAEYIFQY